MRFTKPSRHLDVNNKLKHGLRKTPDKNSENCFLLCCSGPNNRKGDITKRKVEEKNDSYIAKNFY